MKIDILKFFRNIFKNSQDKIALSSTIDLNSYDNIEDMKGYIGFITPDGLFYRVRNIGGMNGNHGEWGYSFLCENRELGLKPSLDFDKNIIMLVEFLGYALLYECGVDNKGILSSNSPIDVYPEYKYLSRKQQEIVSKLIGYQNSKCQYVNNFLNAKKKM